MSGTGAMCVSVEKIVKRNEAGSELSRKSGLGAEHGAGAERYKNHKSFMNVGQQFRPLRSHNQPNIGLPV
jgi:hypothetical protein